jgi:hypothetical protein
MEQPKCSAVAEWKKNQNVVYMQSGIIFSYKKGCSDICYNMYEPRKHYTKWNNPDINR